MSKLFDLAFDSGANPAMPWQAYNVRQLRLINIMHFAQMLDVDDLKEFWTIFTEQDADKFGVFLKGIADRVKRFPFRSTKPSNLV